MTNASGFSDLVLVFRLHCTASVPSTEFASRIANKDKLNFLRWPAPSTFVDSALVGVAVVFSTLMRSSCRGSCGSWRAYLCFLGLIGALHSKSAWGNSSKLGKQIGRVALIRLLEQPWPADAAFSALDLVSECIDYSVQVQCRIILQTSFDILISSTWHMRPECDWSEWRKTLEMMGCSCQGRGSLRSHAIFNANTHLAINELDLSHESLLTPNEHQRNPSRHLIQTFAKACVRINYTHWCLNYRA